jgi:hypothetical protein
MLVWATLSLKTLIEESRPEAGIDERLPVQCCIRFAFFGSLSANPGRVPAAAVW